MSKSSNKFRISIPPKFRLLLIWALILLTPPAIYIGILVREIAAAGPVTSYEGRDLVETASYKVIRIPGDDDSATGFYYHVVQHPGRVISGKPATFIVTVTKNGQPIANRQFKAGITHAYGMFITSRAEDTTDSTYTSDAHGSFTVSYQSRFVSLQPDRGFGFNIGPILTAAEEADIAARQAAGKLTTNPNIGISFDLTIYPRWLDVIF